MKHRVVFIVLVLQFLSACSSLYGSHGVERGGASSSLVEFLYPDGEIPPDVDGVVPTMNLPLRVGIAFVPGSESGISEAEKSRMLEEVADAFRDRPYVAHIEAIPGVYLRRRMGTIGMQQTARLFDVDVIALVSYDQHRFSSERDSAIFYWTIVGAAIAKGNTNEVHTMIDTAVFDVETAKLLFRAPGLHSDSRNATLIEGSRKLQALGAEGFRSANVDMIANLHAELDVFEQRVRNGEAVAVTGGGGSADLLSLGVFGLAVIVLAIRRRHGESRREALP